MSSIGHMLVFAKKKSVETFKKHVVSNSLAGSSPKTIKFQPFLEPCSVQFPVFRGTYPRMSQLDILATPSLPTLIHGVSLEMVPSNGNRK